MDSKNITPAYSFNNSLVNVETLIILTSYNHLEVDTIRGESPTPPRAHSAQSGNEVIRPNLPHALACKLSVYRQGISTSSHLIYIGGGVQANPQI